MKYGLSKRQLNEIIQIISTHPEVEEAVLFGSRVIDTFKEASDVDIAIKGKNVTASLAAKLKYRFEEDTYLPFFFDFVAYPTITNEELKEHIDTKGVSIYRAGMSEWKESIIDDIALINPTEKLAKGIPAKKIAMEVLKPFTKKVPCYTIEPYNGGMKFRNGDTIIARITPCLENGKAAYIDILNDKEVGFGSTEYIVLREREGVSDKHFLYYFVSSQDFREVAILSMTGSSGRQRVQTDVVRNHSFFLPPLPEQKAIASVLSSLDDKIDLLHRQIKTLEAMAETLFRQWFVEEAMEDWKKGRLGDYINIKHGYAFKGAFITTEKNKQILVTPGNFNIGGGFKSGKMKYFSSSDYPEDFVFSPDDLVVTMTDLSKNGDTLGYPALIPTYNRNEVLYLHNQRIGKVEFKKDISKYFIYYLMKTDEYQWFILG